MATAKKLTVVISDEHEIVEYYLGDSKVEFCEGLLDGEKWALDFLASIGAEVFTTSLYSGNFDSLKELRAETAKQAEASGKLKELNKSDEALQKKRAAAIAKLRELDNDLEEISSEIEVINDELY